MESTSPPRLPGFLGFLVAASLLAAACGGGEIPAPATLEDLGRLSIRALREDRVALLEPALFTRADLEWLVGAMRDQEGGEARRMVERYDEAGPDGMLAEVREQVRMTFRRTRDAGEEEEVDWSALRFDRLHDVDRVTVAGVEVARFHVRLRIGDAPGEISIRTVFRSPRGWLLAGGFRD